MRYSVAGMSLAAMAAALVLSGCASSRYCLKPQKYQTATSLPPLTGTADLKIPDSSGALHIPDAPANAVPFGYEDAEGKAVCLDHPPLLTLPPETKKKGDKSDSDKALEAVEEHKPWWHFW